MIKVGISQCLMGAKVRYDGGHKQNRFCKDVLSEVFDFVSLCPEVGIGLTTPRKTIRLVGDPKTPRAVLSDDIEQDFTDALEIFAEEREGLLAELSGYIFCKASPSCGVERVKVYRENGYAEKTGIGIFAARVRKLFPHLPLEEDGRLNDPLLRDSFIKRVYVYSEWQKINKSGLSTNNLFRFHARHKMTLLAHCQKTYRMLGPLVASANPGNLKIIANQYFGLLMQALAKVATRSNNTNVLMHLQGYLKNELSADDKAELTQSILGYRNGTEPILAPLALLKHHFRNFPNLYVEEQSFLEPYPKQLAIRVKMQ
ncbi:YbgA family protein [Aliikangiella coralliicola]|uniref:DUF1722 domain-containing protein n=1 Tax=Aliikangiella coralliicola TaxID=2592383 RepID=A0A545U6B1_9GAMM|nr:DUF523 and DUF1722 domain-containing protein [Aliikangiella coralliicola]TQV84943.1 DUF1722 domain-containing protein [Aliikangiella coralliicola]